MSYIVSIFKKINFRKNDLEEKLLKLNLEKKIDEKINLKKDVLDWVLEISDDSTFTYKNKIERLFLNILYENGEIYDFEILDALEKGYVFKKSRESYRNSTIIYADHCISPKYLAEGIIRNQFSNLELEKIRFDHGENQFTFYNIYGEINLIENLKENLLNPKLPKKKIPKKQLELFKEKKENFCECFC